MWIDWQAAIVETAAELEAAERRARGRRQGDRVRLLRLLKEGTCRSLGQTGAVLGYSERQVQRWWARYRAQGLSGVLAPRPPASGCYAERLPAELRTELEAEMIAGRIARLKDAQAWLAERGVAYSLSGLSDLFRRHRTKRKTGRPRHRAADPAAQAAFKKEAACCAASAPRRAPLRAG